MSEAPPPHNGNDWTTTLPEDLRPMVTAKGWKGPEDALRSYDNLQKTLGQKRLPAPAPDWKPEQWQSFYKEAGLPDSPDKYITPEHKFPDGVQLDETKMKEAKTALHKAGLLPHQANDVLKYYFDVVSKEATTAMESRKREQEAAEFKLRDEWNGDYDVNVKVAKDALVKFGGDEAVNYLNESGLGNHPALIRMLANIGKGMMEDKAGGRGAGSTNVDGAEAAKAVISQMRGDAEFMKKFTSGDKEAGKKWEDAFKTAYPEPQKAV